LATRRIADDDDAVMLMNEQRAMMTTMDVMTPQQPHQGRSHLDIYTGKQFTLR
jgi:hypothetical protein